MATLRRQGLIQSGRCFLDSFLCCYECLSLTVSMDSVHMPNYGPIGHMHAELWTNWTGHNNYSTDCQGFMAMSTNLVLGLRTQTWFITAINPWPRAITTTLTLPLALDDFLLLLLSISVDPYKYSNIISMHMKTSYSAAPVVIVSLVLSFQ